MKNVLANGFVPTLIAVIWKAGGTIGTYPVDMNRFPVQSYLFLCFFGLGGGGYRVEMKKCEKKLASVFEAVQISSYQLICMRTVYTLLFLRPRNLYSDRNMF